MASRPGIRTLNNTGYNTIGRPTSPAADRGSGVRQINPALAGSKERTQVLATGRRGKPPQRVSLATAATAAGTVLTQGAQNLLDAGREGFENLTDAVKRIFPENVPLVEIPGINQPLEDVPGVNKPVLPNAAVIADSVIKTSQYSDDLVNEARVRADKGNIISKIYVGAADTVVKGANEFYERAQGPGYTPASKTISGVLKAGANAIATVPAILQAGDFYNNPQRIVYNGEIPKTIPGVSVNGNPTLSGNTVSVSIEESDVVNTVLGESVNTGGELAKKYLPKMVDSVVTEFKENPYGVVGQVLGGAVLAKGVGAALPKKITPAKLTIEGKPATSSRVTGGANTPSRGGANVVIQDNAAKLAGATGLAGGAAYVTENIQFTAGKTPTVPQRVVTYTFTGNTGFIDDLVDEYPKREEDENKNKTPGNTNNQNAGGTLVIRPTEGANVLRIQGSTLFRPEFSPRVDYVKITEIMGENTGTKNNTRYSEENAEANRTQNRVREEFAYEYATVTTPRGNRGKRRIDIDINLPRKVKGTKKRRVRKYAKRQIVNPIPWLWDEEPGFAADIPKEVEMVSISTLLA